MSYPIEKIEGIGPSYAKKLQKAGIRSTKALLSKCGTPAGRKDVAKTCGIDDGYILKWTNMADLMRIRGVGEEYSELLEAAGVDTVKELKMRNADNLTAKMAEVNADKKLVRQLPALSKVKSWVEQAKSLEPAISY
ncbi:MAG: DUF4332 domain-containing protein [Pseudomonadota bacterium]